MQHKIVNVRVGWSDWWHGQRKQPRGCMVARAIKRETGLNDVWVGVKVLRINGRSVGKTSQEISEKIRAFDRGWPVRPFTIAVPVPVGA